MALRYAAQSQALRDRVNGYNTNLAAYKDFLAENGAGTNNRVGVEFWQRPDVMERTNALSQEYADLNRAGLDEYNVGRKTGLGLKDPSAQNILGLESPQMGEANKGGFSRSLMGPIFALVGNMIAPGIGTALGAGIGSLGSGQPVGKSLLNAGIAYAGSKLFSGGAKDLLGSTSLSSGAEGLSAADNQFLANARSAIGGGGSSGGFASAIGEGASLIDDIKSGFSSFVDNPVGYAKDTITSGVKDMFSPKNLLKSGLKAGFSYALQKDNDGGYDALQNASKTAAGLYRPFLDSGTVANKTLADLLGSNGPDAAKAAMDGWQMDPSFTFTRDQGIKSLDASAAKRGMLLSGNQVQATQDYGTGLANTYFQNYLQNLARQSQQGQAAAEGVGQNTVDAATVYAMMKANKANNFNRMLGGFSNFV